MYIILMDHDLVYIISPDFGQFMIKSPRSSLPVCGVGDEQKFAMLGVKDKR